MVLVDSNSTNGTYVNGVRVKEKKVAAQDEIVLGSYRLSADELLGKVKARYLEQKTDFSEEFVALEPQFLAFEADKDKLSKPSKWPFVIRLAITAAIMLVVLLVKGLPQELRFVLMMSVGLIYGAITTFSSKQSKRKEKLELLLFEYENKLLCPKCKSKMFRRSLKIWKTKGSCDNGKCNATF
jgi:ribosomal protein L37AE/L43A